MAETAEPNPTIKPPDRRKLIAVLYADMVGYSRLIGLDDVGTLQRLRALRANLIDPAIEEHGGRIVQTAGDSLLIVFDSIDGAMRCAVKVQRRVPVLDGDQPPDRAIRFRAGIDIGDAIADGTDLHGAAVNVAARLQAECPPGGVCVSRSVRDHVHGRFDLAFEALGPLNLKNIARPVDTFVVRLDATDRPLAEPGLAHHSNLPHLNPCTDRARARRGRNRSATVPASFGDVGRHRRCRQDQPVVAGGRRPAGALPRRHVVCRAGATGPGRTGRRGGRCRVRTARARGTAGHGRDRGLFPIQARAPHPRQLRTRDCGCRQGRRYASEDVPRRVSACHQPGGAVRGRRACLPSAFA